MLGCFTYWGKQVRGAVKIDGYNHGYNPHKLGYGTPVLAMVPHPLITTTTPSRVSFHLWVFLEMGNSHSLIKLGLHWGQLREAFTNKNRGWRETWMTIWKGQQRMEEDITRLGAVWPAGGTSGHCDWSNMQEKIQSILWLTLSVVCNPSDLSFAELDPQ